MSFKKYATISISSVSSADFIDGALVFKKTAQAQNSFYQRESNKINVKDLLSKFADKYAISANPSDYIFEAVRALTAEVANQNGDAFGKSELLRFDDKLGKAVYQTFIGCPHQINHRAENPKTARGIVLDASYNTGDGKILDECPTCKLKTAEASNRDESGLNCKRCATTVKDEFVELLLAIDTKKDPTFAEGVRNGSLDSLSMGCTASYTDCSICANRATSTSEFCQHIRHGNKKKMFKSASGFNRMAFELCGGVQFEEISRVDQPADPTALQREVFSVQATNIPLSVESEMLIMSSKVAKLESMIRQAQLTEPVSSPSVPFKSVAESIRWAEDSVRKLEAEISALTMEKEGKYKLATEENRPFYAWESAAFDTRIKANREYISRLGSYIEKAREIQASNTPWEKTLTKQVSRFFASKEAQALGDITENADQLEQLKVMHPELSNEIDQLSTDNVNVPEQISIDDYTKKHEESFDKNVTPGEIGMKVDQEGGTLPNVMANKIFEKISADLDNMITAAKENNVDKFKFRKSYNDIEVTVTKVGNAKVHTKAGTLFFIRPENKPATKEAATQLATDILSNIAANGLVDTATKYKAILSPKIAQVLQHHIEDFADGREEGDKHPIDEGGDSDGTNAERGKPEKSVVKEEHTDRKDEVREKRDQSNSMVSEDHEPDHDEGMPDGVRPSTDNPGSDGTMSVREKSPKSTLQDAHVDYKDHKPKTASTKEAQVMDKCSCLPGKCACAPGCMNCSSEKSACGCPCGKQATVDDTKKYTSRLERLYKARLDKIKTETEAKLANAAKVAEAKATSKLLRALKLASKRQELNMEASPLKVAMFDTLTAELDIDDDSFFPGMDNQTAARIIEASASTGFDQFTDSLVKRASEFMLISDEAFNALEADVKNLQPIAVNVQFDRTAAVLDNSLRTAAVSGNLVIAPSVSDEGISNTGNRDNIRSALGSTKVRRASQNLIKR